ncbi:MAG: TonB system transport protein ExbD, partial [Mesorhizobium sp.]
MEVMNLLRAAGYLKIALVGLETASGTGAAAAGATSAPATSGSAAQ